MCWQEATHEATVGEPHRRFCAGRRDPASFVFITKIYMDITLEVIRVYTCARTPARRALAAGWRAGGLLAAGDHSQRASTTVWAAPFEPSLLLEHSGSSWWLAARGFRRSARRDDGVRTVAWERRPWSG